MSKENSIFIDEETVKRLLHDMEKESTLRTNPVLVKESDDIRMVTFSDYHSSYLSKHPKVNPEYYLSNLRTMIKIR